MIRLSCLLLLVMLYACKNTASDEKDFITTKSNFQYKIISAPSGDSLQTGDVVKVQLQQYIDDSLLNDTYDNMPVYVKLDTTTREFDFTEILPRMKLHDSAVCIFPTTEIIKKAGNAGAPPDFIKKGKNIRIFIKVVDRFTADSLGLKDYNAELQRFQTKATLKEQQGFTKAAGAFDSLIQTVKEPLTKLPNGVYVQWLQKGSGRKIKTGDSVAIAYKGMLANGTTFETTTMQNPFVLAIGQGNAVEGFDSGIMALTFGDKARIYIPADKAYGPNPAGDKIPAFSNLVFEVEVKPASGR